MSKIILLLALVAVLPLTAAGAATDPAQHLVVMGAVDPGLPNQSPRPPAGPGRSDRFEYLAYYPDQLQVHRGDTVRFRRDGFHTVTFTPEGEPRRGWIRRDEIEGMAAEDSATPSDPDCGASGKPPCVLDSTTGHLNSGWRDLAVTVDLPEGATATYYCMLHQGMEGTIEVVPSDQSLPEAAELEADRRRAVAEDTARGAALLHAGQTPKAEPDGDHVRWSVMAGDFTADDRVAMLRFMPATLEVAPGDVVDFVLPPHHGPVLGRPEAAGEPHTVTFPHDPTADAIGMLRYLSPACDPDEVDAGLPGVPAMYPALFAGCPPGTNFEMLFQPNAWRVPVRAPGDVVATPLTEHDSGLMVRQPASPDVTAGPCRNRCDPWTDEPYPSSLHAVFPTEGTFSYVCLVHPEWGMAGSVTVAGD